MVRQEEGFAPRTCLEAKGRLFPLANPGRARTRGMNAPLIRVSPTCFYSPCALHGKIFNFQPCASKLVSAATHTSAIALPSAMEQEETLDAIHATIARSYLDLEVMLDELCCILARIRFLCSVIAICLIAIVFCEGLRFLTGIWDRHLGYSPTLRSLAALRSRGT